MLIECALTIPLTIPTIRPPPTRPEQIEQALNVSRQFPSGSG
jgi:hypothetical protein